MKTTLKTLLIATTLAGGLTAGLAHAMPPGGDCGEGPRAMGFDRHGMDADARIERMAATLNLSKEQRDKVRAIVDKARPQSRELRDKLADNHKQLRALMEQGTPKEADVRKLADTQGKLIADMIVQRTRVHGEISAVLTPEQRDQLKQRFQQRGRFGGPRSSMQDDGGPEHDDRS